MHIFDKPPQEELMCKICHTSENDPEKLAHPCLCKGSMKYIHQSCLFEWLKNSSNKKCGICKYEYKFKKVYSCDMPKNLPLLCILSYAFNVVKSKIKRIFCLLYFILKYLAIFMFNGISFYALIFGSSVTSFSLFYCIILSCFSTLINYIHRYYYVKIRAVIKSTRQINLNSRQTLLNMTTDLSSRAGSSETDFQTLATMITRQSRPTDLDDSIDEDSADESEDSNASRGLVFEINPYLVPTFQQIKEDVINFFAFTSFSWTLPIFHLYKIFVPFFSYYPQLFLHKSVISFINGQCINDYLCFMHSLILLVSILCYISYLFMVYAKSKICRFAYYYLKVYIVSVLATMYSFTILGTSIHYYLYKYYNNENHLITISNSVYSFIVHALIGLLIGKSIQIIKEKYVIIFRDGFVNTSFRKDGNTFLFRYALETPLPVMLKKLIYNLLYYILILNLTLYIQSFNDIGVVFRMDLSNIYVLAFFCKIFSLMISSQDGFTDVLSYIYICITKYLAKLFNLENMFFNTKICRFEKADLIWDLNVPFTDDRKKAAVEYINNVISKDDDISTVDEEVSNSTHLNFEQEQSTPSIRSFRSAATRPESLKGKATSGYLKEKYERLKMKYSITDKRIEKYFGVQHKKQYSIFYRPRFYRLYKNIIFACCFVASQILFYLWVSSAIFITKLNIGNLDPQISFLLAFGIVLKFISTFKHLKKGSFRILTLMTIKHLLIYFYTNVIWPIASAFIYMVVFSEGNDFIQFSKLFVLANSASSVVEYFLKIVAFSMRIEDYSFVYIFRSISSFMCLKVFLLTACIFYLNCLRLSIIFICAVSITLAVSLVSFINSLISGKLFDKIRDEFFLKEKIVINLEECEERK